MRSVSTFSVWFCPTSTMHGMFSKRPRKVALALLMGRRSGAVSGLKPFATSESAKAAAVLLREMPLKVRCWRSAVVGLCASAGVQSSRKDKSRSCFIFLITCFWVEYYGSRERGGLLVLWVFIGVLGGLGILVWKQKTPKGRVPLGVFLLFKVYLCLLR